MYAPCGAQLTVTQSNHVESDRDKTWAHTDDQEHNLDHDDQDADGSQMDRRQEDLLVHLLDARVDESMILLGATTIKND